MALLARFSSLSHSLFYKSLAIGLRPYLSGDSDLCATRKAVFVCTPFTDGVPVGSSVKQEVTNEQVYRVADVIQDIKRPVFQFDGDGSYFTRQYQYLLNLHDEKDTREEKARKKVARCLANTKTAYTNDVGRYQSLLPSNPGLNFMSWMDKYGYDYNSAMEDLKEAQGELARSQSEQMSDVKARLSSMLSARSSTAYVTGSNMPALLSDYTVLSSHSNNSSLFYPSDVAAKADATTKAPTTVPGQTSFRPLYYLSNYQDTVESWIEGFQNGGSTTTSVQVGFGQAIRETWASLGFEELDRIDAPTPPTAIPLWHSISSSLSPPGTHTHPQSSPQDDALAMMAQDTKLTIKVSGMQPFEVFRGLWNIDNIRSLLPNLALTAPAIVTTPFFKTTRLLLGYGIDMSLSVQHSTLQQASHLASKSSNQLIGEYLASLNVPEIEANNAKVGATVAATALPKKRAPPNISKDKKGPTSSKQAPTRFSGHSVVSRKDVWQMTSKDNGTPLLLGVLGVLT